MPVNPAFLAARENERRLRDLAHLHACCRLPLSHAGRVITRTPVVPFTLRHRLELRLAGNAFFHVDRPILLGDVFLFLWRLHPLHAAPLPARAWALAPLARSHFRLVRLWFALGSLRSACIHRRLTRLVRSCDLSASIAAIHTFLATTEQDAPGVAHSSSRPSRVAPPRSSADNLIDYLMTTYRFSHAEALDFPLALSHQLYRERLLQKPDGELDVFAPSDALLSA